MNKKMVFGIVFLSGILVLSEVSIHGNETIESQKQSHKNSANLIRYTKKESDLDTTEVVNVDDFADVNFVGMDENDIVFQINNGGFLSSTICDPETVKREYIEINPGDKLTAMTVSEAKEYYRTELKNYYASLKKER